VCGFSGFIGRIDKSTSHLMLSEIAHRGPDAQEHFHDEKYGVNLSHARLEILDINTGGQPMLSHDDRFVIVFNGEIYNHRSLRQQLEKLGHSFNSQHSDTEVIIEAYRHYGEDVARHLKGMWGFVIFDRSKKSLFFSRDRFGKKPLFYSIVNKKIIFGSELSAVIKHPDIAVNVNKLAMAKYFANGYVPSPMSMIDGVNKLDAGCNLTYSIEDGNSKVTRYWRYEVNSDRHKSSLQFQSELVDTLFESTKLRMDADVPVGVFLSGGVDSSSIISMAISSGKLKNIDSFSVAFDDPSFDESAYSSDIAKILGTTHKQSLLSKSNALDYLDQISSQLDEPIADSSLLPTYAVSKLASEDLKVVLGGDGADELFAGYDPFKALAPSMAYHSILPSPLRSMLRKAANILPVSHSNMSFDYKVKKTLSGLVYDKPLWNPVWLSPTDVSTINALLGTDFSVEEIFSDAIDSWTYCQSDSLIDKTSQFYIEQYMKNGILTKIDRASMLNGLEVRSPFLDVDLSEVSSRIPAELKYKNGKTKHILKQSLEHVLPLEVLHRKKKGFGVPIGEWFRDGTLGIDIDRQSSFCDMDILRSIVNNHTNSKKDERLFLWAYLMFDKWQERWGASC